MSDKAFLRSAEGAFVESPEGVRDTEDAPTGGPLETLTQIEQSFDPQGRFGDVTICFRTTNMRWTFRLDQDNTGITLVGTVWQANAGGPDMTWRSFTGVLVCEGNYVARTPPFGNTGVLRFGAGFNNLQGDTVQFYQLLGAEAPNTNGIVANFLRN